MADEKAKVVDKTENKIDSVKSDVPQYKVTADSIKENLMLLPMYLSTRLLQTASKKI